jgi:hypothetical protein
MGFNSGFKGLIQLYLPFYPQIQVYFLSTFYELIEIENNVSNNSIISEIFEKSQVPFLAGTSTT